MILRHLLYQIIIYLLLYFMHREYICLPASLQVIHDPLKIISMDSKLKYGNMYHTCVRHSIHSKLNVKHNSATFLTEQIYRVLIGNVNNSHPASLALFYVHNSNSCISNVHTHLDVKECCRMSKSLFV